MQSFAQAGGALTLADLRGTISGTTGDMSGEAEAIGDMAGEVVGAKDKFWEGKGVILSEGTETRGVEEQRLAGGEIVLRGGGEDGLDKRLEEGKRVLVTALGRVTEGEEEPSLQGKTFSLNKTYLL